MAFETVGFQPIILPDGREAISDEMVMNEPWLLDFIKRFPNWYQRSEYFFGWISIEPRLTNSPLEP